MPDILEVVKRAAMDAMNAAKPVAVVFGTVTSVSPLKVNVEQKLTLGADQLILTRNVTDYAVDVTVDWSTNSRLGKTTHRISGFSTSSGGDPSHSHSVGALTTDEINHAHSHSVSGKKTMTVHNALQIGDTVVLLRMIGGQSFIVLDRVVIA